MTVASGVMIDKITKREAWGKEPERRDNLAAFDEFAKKLQARLAESGGKLTVAVKVEPLEPVNDAIDVTPTESA